ncbi:MAG: hypothetical protein EU539_12495 [Promethearchaeota archaeon]|nr:MAG: hypothetical protein EU539_12495 [Candidatus Lokiarchaeota archaeon]
MTNWNNKAYLFLMIGCIQYIILIFIAMLFYAGGTYNNPSNQGYSFWENSLSDLGRTVAYSGKENTISLILFSFTLFLWGFSLIPFFMILPKLFIENDLEKKLSIIGSIFGIIAAFGLIGISFTPDDILDGPHMISVYIAYTSLVLTGLSYSIVFYKDLRIPKWFTCAFIIFTVIQFTTSILGLIGLSSLHTLMTIAQKIGRYTTVIVFALVGYGFLKLDLK